MDYRFNPSLLSIQNPLLHPTSSSALVWDAAAGMMILVPLSVLVEAARPQRAIHVAGDLPLRNTDTILNINAVIDLVPVVPLAAAWLGGDLTFKNLIPSHNQTLTPTAPDTFDGFANRLLVGGASMTLRKYNDGVNAGWGIV